MKNKNIIQIGVSGVLVVILLLILFNGNNRKKPRKGPQNNSLSASAAPSTKKTENIGLYSRLEEETKPLEMNRDPFFKKAPEAAFVGGTPRALRLSGIALDKANPSAIINNKIVTIGMDIEGNTVVDIKEKGVILNDGKHNFELRLE